MLGNAVFQLFSTLGTLEGVLKMSNFYTWGYTTTKWLRTNAVFAFPSKTITKTKIR
jgi:hypothetical protein